MQESSIGAASSPVRRATKPVTGWASGQKKWNPVLNHADSPYGTPTRACSEKLYFTDVFRCFGGTGGLQFTVAAVLIAAVVLGVIDGQICALQRRAWRVVRRDLGKADTDRDLAYTRKGIGFGRSTKALEGRRVLRPPLFRACGRRMSRGLFEPT